MCVCVEGCPCVCMEGCADLFCRLRLCYRAGLALSCSSIRQARHKCPLLISLSYCVIISVRVCNTYIPANTKQCVQ